MKHPELKRQREFVATDRKRIFIFPSPRKQKFFFEAAVIFPQGLKLFFPDLEITHGHQIWEWCHASRALFFGRALNCARKNRVKPWGKDNPSQKCLDNPFWSTSCYFFFKCQISEQLRSKEGQLLPARKSSHSKILTKNVSAKNSWVWADERKKRLVIYGSKTSCSFNKVTNAC